MDIVELLQTRGLPIDRPRRIKMMRHKDSRYDVYELEREGHLETYQKYQGKPVLDCDYVVSLLGGEGTKALFLGVYGVGGRKDKNKVPSTPKDFPYPEFGKSPYYYDLKEVEGFDDLKKRVVIEWGKSAVSWHQWLDPNKPKEVIETLPKGYVGGFPGYLDIVLSYSELQRLVRNPSANKVWHTLLREVAGIYLIVDGKTGKQYVGSAYGKNGILGRWVQYAQNGHGNNKQLKELLRGAPEYALNFRYTILCTLPNITNRNEVLKFETLFKKKLGSRSHGLNSN